MLRVALAAAVVAIASMAHASGSASLVEAPAAPTPSCHPGQSLDLDCALHALDANGDGNVSAAELANFAQPAPPAFDWAPLPPHRAGLDFKDAAAAPEPAAPIALDHNGPPPMLSALLALGALVVLLRRRPT